MANRTTVGSGDRFPKDQSSARPSQRTGRPAASASSDSPDPRPAVRLLAFDRARGADLVAGSDEAGRGCLAGPLVAAAVVFDHSRLSLSDLRSLSGLNDSKKVRAEDREDVYAAILATASSVAIAVRSAAVIDREGLHRTNIEALSACLTAAARPGAIAFSDGFEVPLDRGSSEKLIRGDSRSAAVAAASIVAKVTRDRHMRNVAGLFPGYGFERHVGYATEEHREALLRLGPTPIHRRSFKSAAYRTAA